MTTSSGKPADSAATSKTSTVRTTKSVETPTVKADDSKIAIAVAVAAFALGLIAMWLLCSSGWRLAPATSVAVPVTTTTQTVTPAVAPVAGPMCTQNVNVETTNPCTHEVHKFAPQTRTKVSRKPTPQAPPVASAPVADVSVKQNAGATPKHYLCQVVVNGKLVADFGDRNTNYLKEYVKPEGEGPKCSALRQRYFADHPKVHFDREEKS